MDNRDQIKKIIEPPKPRKINIEKLFLIPSHKMPNGTIMSGKKHTKNSKVIKKGKGKSKAKKSGY